MYAAVFEITSSIHGITCRTYDFINMKQWVCFVAQNQIFYTRDLSLVCNWLYKVVRLFCFYCCTSYIIMYYYSISVRNFNSLKNDMYSKICMPCLVDLKRIFLYIMYWCKHIFLMNKNLIIIILFFFCWFYYWD